MASSLRGRTCVRRSTPRLIIERASPAWIRRPVALPCGGESVMPTAQLSASWLGSCPYAAAGEWARPFASRYRGAPWSPARRTRGRQVPWPFASLVSSERRSVEPGVPDTPALLTRPALRRSDSIARRAPSVPARHHARTRRRGPDSSSTSLHRTHRQNDPQLLPPAADGPVAALRSSQVGRFDGPSPGGPREQKASSFHGCLPCRRDVRACSKSGR